MGTSERCRAALLCAALFMNACGTTADNHTGSGSSGSGSSGSGGRDAGSEEIAPAMACNGHPELCDKPFNQVAFPATHNAMSNADEGFTAPNQQYSMRRQLDDGIRAMLIDTHYWQNDLYLCHSICELGHTLLSDGLGQIKSFMDANPNEVITLILQDGITPADTEKAFMDSGLIQFVYVHPPGTAWPTLRQMIEQGTRLVVTAEQQGPPPSWYHHVWDLAWDTPYSFKSQSEFSCNENRGTKGNDLFLLNHWLENPLPTVPLAEEANRYDVLSGRAKQCQMEGGQLPNFVAVNFYHLGALFQVVNELNGL